MKERERARERKERARERKERERERKREREILAVQVKGYLIMNHSIIRYMYTYTMQTKFMPHTSDSVLVTAARDGQIRCHVMSSSGSLLTSKRVSHHRDSAHKVL